MNNMVYMRREKPIQQDENIKTTAFKYLEFKKNTYEKFNMKISKKTKLDVNKEIKNDYIEKIRPKTFDIQKRTNNQTDKFEKMFNIRKLNKSKPIKNIMTKDNNLMKFKKKTNGFDDLIPFDDINRFATKDLKNRNSNANNFSKNRIKINYADKSSFLVSCIEIEKNKVNRSYILKII